MLPSPSPNKVSTPKWRFRSSILRFPLTTLNSAPYDAKPITRCLGGVLPSLPYQEEDLHPGRPAPIFYQLSRRTGWLDNVLCLTVPAKHKALNCPYFSGMKNSFFSVSASFWRGKRFLARSISSSIERFTHVRPVLCSEAVTTLLPSGLKLIMKLPSS
jgi:hypothetical protein